MTTTGGADQLTEAVRNYLRTHHALTLATASPGGVPHATTLVYANEERTFYVWLRRDTLTARHIAQNPSVAFTVDVYAPDWRKTKGVQASGQASELTDPAEREKALLAFDERFPELVTDDAEALAFFRIDAAEIHFIDSEAGRPSDAPREIGTDFHREVAFSVFHDLPRERVEEVVADLRSVSVDAGEVVVRQGDQADAFFIVVSGEVEVTREGDGEETTVASLGSGQFFGEIAILRGQPRSATVRAVRPTALLALDRDTFRDLIAQSLGTTARLDEIIKERLADAGS